MIRRSLLAVLLWQASFAFACGYCVEDKIAACYDYAVIESARRAGKEVAFFALQGKPLQDPALAAKLKKQVESERGVLRGSARVSVESAALSFAYDPRRSNAVAIADALEKRTGLSLGLLKVLDRSVR